MRYDVWCARLISQGNGCLNCNENTKLCKQFLLGATLKVKRVCVGWTSQTQDLVGFEVLGKSHL